LLHELLGLSVMTVTRRMVEGLRPKPAAVVLAKFRTVIRSQSWIGLHRISGSYNLMIHR
jgi:hypothetical protein